SIQMTIILSGGVLSLIPFVASPKSSASFAFKVTIGSFVSSLKSFLALPSLLEVQSITSLSSTSRKVSRAEVENISRASSWLSTHASCTRIRSSPSISITVSLIPNRLTRSFTVSTVASNNSRFTSWSSSTGDTSYNISKSPCKSSPLLIFLLTTLTVVPIAVKNKTTINKKATILPLFFMCHFPTFQDNLMCFYVSVPLIYCLDGRH